MAVTVPPAPASPASPGSSGDGLQTPPKALDMDAATADAAGELPTVDELLLKVSRLRQAVRSLDPTTSSNEAKSSATTPDRRMLASPGIYGRKAAISPYKDGGPMHRGELDASMGMTTPPPRKGITSSRTMPRPTRVAALTRENVSLLPRPTRNVPFAGSVAGSQQSRTSVRTDGGAVFSRLYQPDFYKHREEKLKAQRDRRDSLQAFAFTPRTNHRRELPSSRDSVGSGSVTSLQSAKTDVGAVSSRLYDPEYTKKRNARLVRLREEREMRDCTFAPTINPARRKKDG